MLFRERRLWAPAAAPVGFSVLALVAAAWLLFAFGGELYAWATGWMPELAVETWYAWAWVGPAKVLLTLLGVLLFAALAGAALVISFLFANILAAPFLEVLSSRVEFLAAGSVRDQGASGLAGVLGDAARSLWEELKRSAFFLAVVAALTALGFAIPGAQLVTGPAIVAFAVFFLPLDYASYALDRRRLSFGQKRRWLLDNKGAVSGFGLAAFLICWIPGLNFFAMPLMVAGGTLLTLRYEPVVAPPS
jgi:CysZ protein